VCTDVRVGLRGRKCVFDENVSVSSIRLPFPFDGSPNTYTYITYVFFVVCVLYHVFERRAIWLTDVDDTKEETRFLLIPHTCGASTVNYNDKNALVRRR